jgi:hypothetical protein
MKFDQLLLKLKGVTDEAHADGDHKLACFPSAEQVYQNVVLPILRGTT